MEQIMKIKSISHAGRDTYIVKLVPEVDAAPEDPKPLIYVADLQIDRSALDDFKIGELHNVSVTIMPPF